VRRTIPLLLGVSLLLVLPLVPMRAGYLGGLLFNAGHFPLFVTITVLVFQAIPSRWGGEVLRWVTTALIGIGLTLLIELIQPLVSRNLSFEDFLTGLLGIGAGLGGIAVWQRFGTRARLGYALLCAAVCLVLLLPAWREWKAIMWRAERLPLLADFEEDIELRLWEAQGGRANGPSSIALSAEQVSSGHRSLRVNAAEGNWAGTRYNAGEQNWSDYDELVFDIYNPGEPFRFSIRIDDVLEQDKVWFVRKTTLPRGWSELRVPMEQIRIGTYPQKEPRREVDLGRIWRLMLSTGKNQPGRVFFVDHVRLIRNSAEPTTAGSPR